MGGIRVELECIKGLTDGYTHGLYLLMVGHASPVETSTKPVGIFGSQGAVSKELVRVDCGDRTSGILFYKPCVIKVAQA